MTVNGYDALLMVNEDDVLLTGNKNLDIDDVNGYDVLLMANRDELWLFVNNTPCMFNEC
jgi:hypothetical protein